MTEEGLMQILEKHDQLHIRDHYYALSPEKRRLFIEESEGLDFDLAFNLYRGFTAGQKGSPEAGAMGPAPIVTLPKTAEEASLRREARQEGEALLAQRKVAVLIVAGGQGSRLGFEGPKGAFPISPVKDKTLFRLFCESVKAMSLRYGAAIPLLVMTSRENDAETRTYFESNSCFGLDPKGVHFFQQGMLPSVTPEGALMLKDETHLFTNPDGHGGSLKAIHDSGLVDRLVDEGITKLFYCQVDNPLVKIADPVFLGYHQMAGAEMSTKVVRRFSIGEKVGVYVTLNGKEAIVEYSDFGGRHMAALDAQGDVLYWGGNTGIHALDLSFIKRLNSHGFALPYHRALRPVDVFSPKGRLAGIEGWKFETFVFDAIPLARKTCCMEVRREEEFSPVKNSDGPDSPRTARAAMSNLFGRWLAEAGITTAPDLPVEVSPLFAIDKETFVKKLGKKLGKKLNSKAYSGDGGRYFDEESG